MTATSISPSTIPTPSHHPRKHQHPHQKHRAYDPERKHSLPLLADALLLQPGQRVQVQRVLLVAEDVRLAVAVDVSFGPEELDRGFDDSRDEEDE
jgi:hypothetical protein